MVLTRGGKVKDEDDAPQSGQGKRFMSPSGSQNRGHKRARRAQAAAVTPADSQEATQNTQLEPDPRTSLTTVLPPRQLNDQVGWEPVLTGFAYDAEQKVCPGPQEVTLGLPTSANATVWREYGDDTDIFNVGLVADTSPGGDASPVAVAAVDLLAASEWFKIMMGMRNRMGGGAAGREGGLRSLVIPLQVPREALVTIVQGLYEGRLRLCMDNVEAVLRVADALQMEAVLEACDRYLLEFVDASEGDGAPFCLAAWNLAQEVQRCSLSRAIARHVIGIGMYSCRQRTNLRVMVNAQPGPAEVVALLRESYEHRLGRACSELLIMQALFWMQRHRTAEDRHDPASLLAYVQWDRLHRLELEALAHHASGMEEDCPLGSQLHRRLLPLLADSTRPDPPPGGSYLVLQLDVDQIEAPYNEADSVVKSRPFDVDGRSVYIRCWHKPDVGWGLYISPMEKNVRLSAFCSHAAHFFLSHDWSKEGRLVHFRQPYSLKETTKGSNLGMAGQISKMVQQHGDMGAVCVHPNGRRTITVGIQLHLLGREAQAEEAKRDVADPDPAAAPAGLPAAAPVAMFGAV